MYISSLASACFACDMYLENTAASQKHDKLRNGDHTLLASRISQLSLTQSKVPDGTKQTNDLFNNQYTHDNVILFFKGKSFKWVNEIYAGKKNNLVLGQDLCHLKLTNITNCRSRLLSGIALPMLAVSPYANCCVASTRSEQTTLVAHLFLHIYISRVYFTIIKKHNVFLLSSITLQLLLNGLLNIL